MIVADASIILSWAYRETNVHLAEPVLRLIAAKGAIVPAIWPMEIANSLELSLLRERISSEQYWQLLAAIRELDIQVEPLMEDRIWDDVATLARRHHLTIYDAQYLETASRLRLPLATFDNELIAAARAEGVVVLP